MVLTASVGLRLFILVEPNSTARHSVEWASMNQIAEKTRAHVWRLIIMLNSLICVVNLIHGSPFYTMSCCWVGLRRRQPFLHLKCKISQNLLRQVACGALGLYKSLEIFLHGIWRSTLESIMDSCLILISWNWSFSRTCPLSAAVCGKMLNILKYFADTWLNDAFNNNQQLYAPLDWNSKAGEYSPLAEALAQRDCFRSLVLIPSSEFKLIPYWYNSSSNRKDKKIEK